MTLPRPVLSAGLAATTTLVALLTLLPAGSGWRWGAPVSELQWYATSWTSETAMLQLTGNLVLLAPPAALAVLRWPALAAPWRLVPAALSAAASIELLQWLLPLGRVVSPVDALLNAISAVVAGLVVVRMRARVWT